MKIKELKEKGYIEITDRETIDSLLRYDRPNGAISFSYKYEGELSKIKAFEFANGIIMKLKI